VVVVSHLEADDHHTYNHSRLFMVFSVLLKLFKNTQLLKLFMFM